MRTSSTSPGIAPLMKTGPVRMCPPGPRSVTSRRIVRTYSGTPLGGTTPEASTSSGSGPLTVSMMTMSPELMVSTGLSAALKCPAWTLCALGIGVYSAASALGNASADKSKLQIDSAPILAIASSPSRVLRGLRGATQLLNDATLRALVCGISAMSLAGPRLPVRHVCLHGEYPSDRRYFCDCLKYRRSGGG